MSKPQQGEIKQPKMLVGSDDFHDLLLNSDVFVDKTLVIKEFIENPAKVVLITRPRRWGKSMNLDMIRKFLTLELDEEGKHLHLEKRIYDKLFVGGKIDAGFNDGETKLLKPLKIAAYPEIIKKHQGHSPVIYLNFKEIKSNNYQGIENGVKDQILSAFSEHPYLKIYAEENSTFLDQVQKDQLRRFLKGNITLDDLKISIKILCKLLHKHWNRKVYILIDEYDTPLNTAYIEFYTKKREEFNATIMLFQGLFGAAFKTNEFLEKGLITGIMRIAKANLFSGINNVSENCLLDEEFAKYYGFTQNEVDELLKKVPINTSLEVIKYWYNGYHMGGEIIYNPWSIMQCLSRRGKCDTYWLDSGGTGLIDKILLSDQVQGELKLLLEHKPLIKKIHKQVAFDEFEHNSDIFYSLLLFAGYLNADPVIDETADKNVIVYEKYELSIPNNEVRNIYIDRVMGWVTRKLKISMSEQELLIDLLPAKQIDKFMIKLAEYLMNYTSYHDLTQEKDYHNLMGGLLAPLVRKYIVNSNTEVGTGRCDHIIIPQENRGDTAFIFEYKKAKSKKSMEKEAAGALVQIDEFQYDASIKTYQYVKQIIKIGMAFYGKEFRAKHVLVGL